MCLLRHTTLVDTCVGLWVVLGVALSHTLTPTHRQGVFLNESNGKVYRGDVEPQRGRFALPCFVRSADNNELWMSLLEKAVAKYYGMPSCCSLSASCLIKQSDDTCHGLCFEQDPMMPSRVELSRMLSLTSLAALGRSYTCRKHAR